MMREKEILLFKKIDGTLSSSEQELFDQLIANDAEFAAEYNFQHSFKTAMKADVNGIDIPFDLNKNLRTNTTHLLAEQKKSPLVPAWAYLPVIFFIILGASLIYFTNEASNFSNFSPLASLTSAQEGYIKYGGLILCAIVFLSLIDLTVLTKKNKRLLNFFLV